jgi:hypothetical protein
MLIREEAKATRQVLLHMMEIERREIHLARGYGSLHSFAVEVLGYSDGSAARRVAAMRLIREMPETAEQLVQGTLTLETMSTLSNHFRASKPSREVKRQLVASAQNLSKRELEKKLGKPEMTAVYLKPELMKKLEELKLERVGAEKGEVNPGEATEGEADGNANAGEVLHDMAHPLTPPAEFIRSRLQVSRASGRFPAGRLRHPRESPFPCRPFPQCLEVRQLHES